MKCSFGLTKVFRFLKFADLFSCARVFILFLFFSVAVAIV